MSSSDDNTVHDPGKDTLNDAPVRAELTDERLTLALTAELDTAVDTLDDSTVRRLASARRQAVAQASDKRSIRIPGTPWATATAGLATLLVVVLLWFEPLQNSADLIVTDISSTPLESLPILSSADDLEFFQSVDFLIWMEKNSG